MDYRQYLGYHAKNHPSTTKQAEARAILATLGDGNQISKDVMTPVKGGFLGLQDRERQFNGYGVTAINNQLNPWWVDSYNKWNAGQQAQNTQRTGNDTNTQDYGYYASGGGYGYSAPAYNPNEVARFDQAIGQIESARGRLGNQLNIARGNINNQYGVNKNSLQSAYDRANRDYSDTSTQNQQQLRTNYNNIIDQASIGMRGLARLLGSYGAGGSSDMDVAADAVSAEATAERSGAGSNYAQNQRALDTNWGDFQEEDKKQRKLLDEWKANALNVWFYRLS